MTKSQMASGFLMLFSDKQSLTAAALSEPSSVPQGSFSGAEAEPNYKMTCFEIGRIFYQTKNRVCLTRFFILHFIT